MYKIVFIFLILLNTIFAIEIKEIKFDGLNYLSTLSAREIIDIKINSTLNEEKVNKALKNLYKQGYFSDIYITEAKGILTFHFKEKAMISKIEIDGFANNNKDKRKEVLKIKKGSFYNEKKVEETKQNIIKYLELEGYLDNVVEVKKKEIDNKIELKFVVKKGQEVIIESLDIVGLKSFSKSEVEDSLINRQRDFMGWFIGRDNGKLRLPYLENDPLLMEDFYRRRGFLDVNVIYSLLSVDFNNYKANMFYKIDEGEKYKIRNVIINEDQKIIDEKNLYKDLKLKNGDFYNVEYLRNDMKNLKFKIADLGYAYVLVEPSLKRHIKEKEVDIIFNISLGEKVYINDVIIKGNYRTLDRVIRREVFLAPKDLYNLSDLEESKLALKRTGYFDNVIIEERRINERLIDIYVDVKEARTGRFRLGGGYGSYDGFVFDLSISDNNIFGSGKELSFDFLSSKRRFKYSFGLNNPRVFDSTYSLGVNLFKSKNKHNSYNLNSKGFGVSSGKLLGRNLKAYLEYDYVKNIYSDVEENLSYDTSNYIKSSVTPSIVYDSTDDYYTPRNGFILSQSLEFAGVGGNAKFLKSNSSFYIYKGLQDYIDYDLILKYSASLDYLKNNGYIPIGEYFFLGGIGSVRGYSYGSISPVDSNNKLIGGNKAFVNTFAISFPISTKAKFRFSTFMDYGFVGRTSIDQISRGSYGISFDWYSAIGPLQFVFANPINKQYGDDLSFFEFTIGRRF